MRRRSDSSTGHFKMKKRINWKFLIACFVIVYAVAFIGSVFTSSSVNSEWYYSVKPAITPPNWVFPIVWNILFFLMAISLYLIVLNKNRKKNKKAITVFGINLFLNLLWTFFYFRMQNPLLAFYEIAVLWISILILIFDAYEVDKLSSYLLIPYFLWVSFATVLNYMSAF